ncbi:NADP-dependent oxidoreductase [Gracilaria domingensis]|nr:NADP-dependent oxidoreductase [Gracilaria domingensis]
MAAFVSPIPIAVTKKVCASEQGRGVWKGAVTSTRRHDVAGLSSDCPLAVGTWAWGNRLLYDYSPDQDENIRQAFIAAVNNGVSLFDTADSYGTGKLNARAEVLLGKFMKEHGKPVRVATKFASYPWRFTSRSIVNAAEKSCERLGTKIHLAQMHWSPSRYLPLQERALLQGLYEAWKAGYCENIGVSNLGPVALGRAYKYLKERGATLTSVQVQLSLLCREPIESGLLKVAGTRSLSRSGVRGVLFDRLKNDRLDAALQEMAVRKGASVAQVALSWCLKKGVIVLVGCRTERQVVENVGALQVDLSDEESRLLEMAASKGAQMVRNAFQTT